MKPLRAGTGRAMEPPHRAHGGRAALIQAATRSHNRLPPWLRRAIYAATGLLFASGLAWLFVAYALAPADEPTPAPHPWAGPLLALHGCLAYGGLVLTALVGQAHLRTGWRVPGARSLALGLGGTLLGLAATGLGFYYVASESIVPWLRWSHVAAGVLLPAVLTLHVRRGHRLSRP